MGATPDERDLVDTYRALIAEVYELAGRSRATSERFAKRRGQTAARWHVLSVLLDGPHTVPQIAQRLGVTRQSVQRVVDELTDDRSTMVHPNPSHARSHLVALSAGGRRVADTLFVESQAERARHLARSGLSVDDLRAASTTLRTLNAAIRELDD